MTTRERSSSHTSWGSSQASSGVVQGCFSAFNLFASGGRLSVDFDGIWSRISACCDVIDDVSGDGVVVDGGEARKKRKKSVNAGQENNKFSSSQLSVMSRVCWVQSRQKERCCWSESSGRCRVGVFVIITPGSLTHGRWRGQAFLFQSPSSEEFQIYAVTSLGRGIA
jgi:hypothetical protein